MNTHLQQFARTTLKVDLCWCSDDQRMIFKRMYSHNNLTLDINKVVDNMPSDKLDWAMCQVKQTLIKNEQMCHNTCF